MPEADDNPVWSGLYKWN